MPAILICSTKSVWIYSPKSIKEIIFVSEGECVLPAVHDGLNVI